MLGILSLLQSKFAYIFKLIFVMTNLNTFRYTQACAQLIAQYKTALNLVCDSVTDVEKFMEKFIKEYKVLFLIEFTLYLYFAD
jgi:hypothetical protein